MFEILKFLMFRSNELKTVSYSIYNSEITVVNSPVGLYSYLIVDKNTYAIVDIFNDVKRIFILSEVLNLEDLKNDLEKFDDMEILLKYGKKLSDEYIVDYISKLINTPIDKDEFIHELKSITIKK